MATDPKKTPPKPKFGEPEKTDWKSRAMFIGFVVIALGAIVYMVATNKPEKRLNCRAGVGTSLTGFGNCTAE